MQQANLFPTCVVDAVTPEAGMSTVEVLRRMGMDVSVPETATCCGQPAWNAGHADAAVLVARRTLDALHDTEGPIVVPAGSCATMIRVFWHELFELEGTADEIPRVTAVAERTYELSEWIHHHGLPPVTTPDPTPSVYHRSCHMLRELGIDSQPEELLDSAATDRREGPTEDRCCGFGGLFSVKLPEVSVAMADDVLDSYVESGAEQVVGCDASCLMHLRGRASRRDLALTFRHLAEVIDEATTGPAS